MNEIAKELERVREQISIHNGYSDDIRKELSDLNKTILLIAQILRNN